jgi:hypothetical protein
MYHTMCINICHYVNFERIYILNAIIIDGLVGFIFSNCKDNCFCHELEGLIKPHLKRKGLNF